jgi:hypothetical protein
MIVIIAVALTHLRSFVWGMYRPGDPADPFAMITHHIMQDIESIISNPAGYPAPTNYSNWLDGERVVCEKGVIFDSAWRIRKQEISDFKVVKVAKDAQVNYFTATASFNATAEGKGIHVEEGLIRYREDPATDQLWFLEFVPKNVAKIGNW